MKKLRLIALFIMGVNSFTNANSIIYFSDGNAMYHYVLINDHAKPIANWTNKNAEKFLRAKSVDIKKGSSLWEALKKIDNSLALKSISILFTKDASTITRLNATSIPTINIPNKKLNKSFKFYKFESQKQEAQDYNSSRSNKANSIAANPLYNDNGTTGENPLYETKNVIKTGNTDTSVKQAHKNYSQDYNSSRSNKANSISTAQDYNSSRSNKSNVAFSAGFVLSNKNNHMGNGVAFNLNYHISLKNNFGVEAGIGLLSNSFSYTPSPTFPQKNRMAITNSIKNNKWSNIYISVGPSYILGTGKFCAIIYAKATALFTKIPDQTIGYNNNNNTAIFSGKKTSFALNPGISVNYSISRIINVFINPVYFTSLKKNIPYQEKDIAKAVDAKGNFNADTYNSLPLEKRYMGIDLFGVNAGISIHL